MRTTLLALSLVVAAACGSKTEPTPTPAPTATPEPTKPTAPTEPKAEWVEYKGPADCYAVKFPIKPTEVTKDVPVEGAPTQVMKSAVAESPDGSKAYFTAVIDVSVPAGTRYDAKKGVEVGINGLLSRMGGTQDAIETTNWGAFEGRKITYHGTMEGSAYQGLAQVYASSGDKPRIYQVNTINTGGSVTDDMTAFVASFVLNEPKDVPPPAPAPAPEWVVHETPLYSVKLPTKPEENKSMMPTVLGEREMVMYTSTTDTGAYMVGTVAMQVPEGTAFDVNVGMQGGLDGILKSVGSDPAKAKVVDIETGGLKGREVSFVAEQKFEGKEIGGRVRLYLDEKSGMTMYSLMALGLTPLDETAVKTFFDSFMPKKK